jgi:hypothetical protein
MSLILFHLYWDNDKQEYKAQLNVLSISYDFKDSNLIGIMMFVDDQVISDNDRIESCVQIK